MVDSIARRCRASATSPMKPQLHKFEDGLSYKSLLNQEEVIMSPSPPDSGKCDFLGNTLCIGDYDFCNLSSTSDASKSALNDTPAKRSSFLNLRQDSLVSENGMEWLSETGHRTSLALRGRKIRKRRLAKRKYMLFSQSNMFSLY